MVNTSSPEGAKRVIVLATVGTVVLTSIATVQKRQTLPGVKVPIGAFGVGTVLAAMAEFVPSVASGFAVLMLTTAAFATGPDAWAGVRAATAAAPALAGGAEVPRPNIPPIW